MPDYHTCDPVPRGGGRTRNVVRRSSVITAPVTKPPTCAQYATVSPASVSPPSVAVLRQ